MHPATMEQVQEVRLEFAINMAEALWRRLSDDANQDYERVSLVATYSLDSLPTVDQMAKDVDGDDE